MPIADCIAFILQRSQRTVVKRRFEIGNWQSAIGNED
jgi:hypothetical protein